MATYGYIRTSRQRIEGTAGSDPEAQALQLRQAGVDDLHIFRDVAFPAELELTPALAGEHSTLVCSQEAPWLSSPPTASAAGGWTP